MRQFNPMDSPPVFDYAAVTRILPHRAPFLFVDRIIEFEPEKRIVGVKLVTAGEPSVTFQDGRSVLSMAVMLEAVAQVGAILLLAAPERRDMVVYMLGIKRARYRRPAYAGDVAVIEARLDRIKGVMGRMRGEVRVEGERIAHGTMNFALGPRPEVPDDR
jgi:3-hydroxyacyl-[acyl-carrier-protein] dehydratase